MCRGAREGARQAFRTSMIDVRVAVAVERGFVVGARLRGEKANEADDEEHEFAEQVVGTNPGAK